MKTVKQLSVLFLMLVILLFIPGTLAGPCFIGFAIGESLGAAALRIALALSLATPALAGAQERRALEVRLAREVGPRRPGLHRHRVNQAPVGLVEIVPGPLVLPIVESGDQALASFGVALHQNRIAIVRFFLIALSH